MAVVKISAMTPAATLTGDELVEIVQDEGTFSTTTQEIANLAGGGGAGGVEYTDPASQWYGPTGATIDTTSSQISGDPFIVWDGTQWIMYLFRSVTGTPYVKCYYRTAPSLSGTWSSATELTPLQGYHKFVLLVDEEGVPQIVGGNYHGYAVKFAGSDSDKEIYHFTCATLTGTWVLGAKVIAKSVTSGDKDDYYTDCPYAILKNGTVYMWYCGAPSTSLSTYAYARRFLRATATDPAGTFTKDTSDILLPSTSSSDWDYGWLGGQQIRRRPDGTYVMLYNAGSTRPVSAGLEPATSRYGYAYATTLDGPWSKDAGNPYASPTSVPNDAIESTNIWRPHIAFDRVARKWFLFYNTGSGTEKITYARQGLYSYQYTSGSSPYIVQTLPSTTLATLTNSRVNLPPGLYRVRYQVNFIADGTGTSPALDIDLGLRVNGTLSGVTTRTFVGSYAYENKDAIIDRTIELSAAGYIDCSVQVVGGTPVTNTSARHLRVEVERL